MMVYQGNPADWDTPEQGSAVAVGVFDGVHLGHQRVLKALLRGDRGLTRVAMTFGTHPATVLAPDRAPPRLSTLKRRFELLEASGIERIAVLDFDEAMRNLTPAEFVDRFLVEGLNTRIVAVGTGFRFGRDASGTTDTLADLAERRGFAVEVVEIARRGDVRFDPPRSENTSSRETSKEQHRCWVVPTRWRESLSRATDAATSSACQQPTSRILLCLRSHSEVSTPLC